MRDYNVESLTLLQRKTTITYRDIRRDVNKNFIFNIQTVVYFLKYISIHLLVSLKLDYFLNQCILDCWSLNKSWHDPENLARTSMVLHLASHTSCMLREWKAFPFLYLASLVSVWWRMHHHVCAGSSPYGDSSSDVTKPMHYLLWYRTFKNNKMLFYWNIFIYKLTSFYQ